MSHFNKEFSSKLSYSPFDYVIMIVVCISAWIYVVTLFASTLINLLGIQSSGSLFTDMLNEALPLLVIGATAMFATYGFNRQSDARRLVVDGRRIIDGLLGNDSSREAWLSAYRLARLERFEDSVGLTISERGRFSEDFVIYDRCITASYDDAFSHENIYTIMDVFKDLDETLRFERSQ